MDPVSQGVVGAAFAQTAARRAQLATVAWYGALGGMAPDLDVLFQSPTDPLLFLEFHRQFTHSLVFIPIGGLICAFIFYHLFAKKSNLSFRNTYLFSTIGYGSHGIIDTCTTYGTQLYWPFSDARLAWNTVSVIDPLFTIPVIILCLLTLFKKNKKFAY